MFGNDTFMLRMMMLYGMYWEHIWPIEDNSAKLTVSPSRKKFAAVWIRMWIDSVHHREGMQVLSNDFTAFFT